MLCYTNSTKFDPKSLENRGGKRPPFFDLNSMEAEIIADSIESGLSLQKALYLVNMHQMEDMKDTDELATLSSVISVVKRLNPQLKRVKKRKQGSCDPKSAWARARFLYIKQLMVRLGLYEVKEPKERRWDRDILGHLSLDQIGWWDETHRKCLIGGIRTNKDFCLQFKRDKNGLLNPNGEFSNKDLQKLNVKYESEGRFGLGCAKVRKKTLKTTSHLILLLLCHRLTIQERFSSHSVILKPRKY